ncbi:hypothetical protein BD414DRAFT_484436 [Trametes punicea]|nr:hypothetical protein BD414DRAFT_484436 [Trametes punicea]
MKIEAALERERPPSTRARHSFTTAKLADDRVVDYYELLSVPPSASPADIKTAYHRALFASHPDKRGSGSTTPTNASTADIGLLKQAFNTLYTPALRKEYDTMRSASGKTSGPRAAQVVSLEEFEEREGPEGAVWTYPCRCGGQYVFTDDMLEAGQHLVGCGSCSEAVWAGYELVEEADGKDG